jgi:hypothetical protein
MRINEEGIYILILTWKSTENKLVGQISLSLFIQFGGEGPQRCSWDILTNYFLQTLPIKIRVDFYQKSVVCISTMKGPTKYPLFYLNNAPKIVMKKVVFQYVGIRKVKFFEFGFMESPKGNHDKKLNKIYRYFKHIDH